MTKFTKDVSSHQRRNFVSDEAISQDLFNQMIDLPDEPKHEYLKFLVDFYVNKTYSKKEITGLLTGEANNKTYYIKKFKNDNSVRSYDIED